MAEVALNHVATALVRFERPLNWIAVIWSILSIAAYARFISLPDVPYLTDRNAWMIAAPWNAIWWGFLRPEIERRTEEMRRERSDAVEAKPEP